MSTLRALRDRRAGILRASGELFAALDREGRTMSADEINAEDARVAEINEIDASIQRAEAHQERMRGAAGSGGQDTQSGGGFRSLGEQMLAVARAGTPGQMRDPRLSWVPGVGAPSAGPTGLGEGVDADGGFLVDQQFVPMMMDPIWESGEVARRIRRIGVGAGFNGIRMNGVDETSRANGSRWGGIRAYWTGEAALITASQPQFRPVAMELEKLTGLCYATSELLRDTTALGTWLEGAFREEFEFKVEDAIINGSGAGMPLGILNSGAVITVAKETSQFAATILSANITKMKARLAPRSWRNSVWFINQDVEPQLYTLHVAVKNVASSENVGGFASPPVTYVPPGTQGNEYGLLMGRPVIPVEYCATLGTAGDIVLADMSQYLGIDKDSVDAQVSIHVRFLYDEQTFRFILRFNGQPLWSTAVTPYKGTNTVSPFVALATRA